MFVTAVCFVNCHIISTQSCFISFIIGQIGCLLFSRKDNVLLVKYISSSIYFMHLKHVCVFVRGIYLNANDCIFILRYMTDRRQHWLFYYLVSQYLDIDFSSLTHFPVPNDLVYLRLYLSQSFSTCHIFSTSCFSPYVKHPFMTFLS